MRLIFLIIFFLLSGCSKSPTVNNQDIILHKSQLENFLVVTNSIRAADKNFGDSQYYIVKGDWAKDTFPVEFKSFLFEFNKKYARSGIVDCDNFAGLAESFASFSYPSELKSGDNGIAVGTFHYTRSIGTGHAINLIVAQIEGKPQLLFFEPQTSQFVKLNQDEIRSCEFFEFR